MACDFRLVGEAARISDWHLKHLGTGLGSWGASTRWARLVGTTRAKEIILTGKELDAEVRAKLAKLEGEVARRLNDDGSPKSLPITQARQDAEDAYRRMGR